MEAADILRAAIPGIEPEIYEVDDEIVNVVARIQGNGAGRRIILNGHLDTYPINESLPWTVDPLAGSIANGRLYGRGAADMKGGIAASIVALKALSEVRQHWHGEVVLSLAGDEETMGTRGIEWLLKNVPHARGDAAIIGDAGSPLVLRFGEKGFIWLDVEATGRASHGAHVHLGTNAIDRLRLGLDALTGLGDLWVDSPPSVLEAINIARPISESLSGTGESEVLQNITVNIGFVEGGTSMNLVPAVAKAGVDIRIPAGSSTEKIEAEIAHRLGAIDGIKWQIRRRVEPTVTPPDEAIVQTVASAVCDVTGRQPAINMRVGGSDARVFRREGIPTVVYGPTPFNMGGADENVLIEELGIVSRVHALASFNFLT